MTIPTMDSHPIFGILDNFGTFLPCLKICPNEQIIFYLQQYKNIPFTHAL